MPYSNRRGMPEGAEEREAAAEAEEEEEEEEARAVEVAVVVAVAVAPRSSSARASVVSEAHAESRLADSVLISGVLKTFSAHAVPPEAPCEALRTTPYVPLPRTASTE